MTGSMPIHFSAPHFLWLLLLLPVVWWSARRSLAGLSRFRWGMALGLRLAVITLLALALARPQARVSLPGACVIYALDWSDSIPSQPSELRDNLLHYVRQSSQTSGSRDLSGLVYFGANAALEQSPSPTPPPLARQVVISSVATDISSALRLCQASFPRGMRKRVVLVSDGNENRGSALAEAELLRSQGVVVDVYPVKYLAGKEIVADRLILPSRIQPNVPFTAKAIIQSSQPVKARAELTRGGQLKGAFECQLAAGKNVIPLIIPGEDSRDGLLKGMLTYKLEIKPVGIEDDQVDKNNAVFGFTQVDGPQAVLYLDGNTAEAYQFPQLLARLRAHYERAGAAGEGRGQVYFDYRRLGLSDLPPAEDLARYDCVILDNLSYDDLGAERDARLRAAVHDQGVGLIAVGGENAFGPGNYRGKEVEKALPVEMELKNKKIMPNGILLLVLDRSGSMEGDKLAQVKAAAWEAVKVLSPSDYVGIIAFDSQPEWLVKPVLANQAAQIKRNIDRLASNGGTDIPAALKEAHKALARVSTTLKHVVLLSDGQSDTRDYKKLVSDMMAAHITVSTVGIGEPDGQPFMKDIAATGGGRYYFVADPKRLPRVFIKEATMVRRSLIFEESFTPKAAMGSDLLLGILPEMRQLHGYVATSAKEGVGVTVALTSANENADPILAHWRYGLGTAIAFTSDAQDRWGKDWVAWSKYGQFWTKALQLAMRQQDKSCLALSTSAIDGRGRVLADAIGQDGNPIEGLKLAAFVTTPGSESVAVQLREVGVGRYEASMDASAPGNYEVTVASSSGEAKERAYGGFVVSGSAEYDRLEPDLAFLHQLAEKGGGVVLSGNAAQDDLYRRALPPAADYADIWRWLAGLACILFPLDIFFRRVMVDYGELWHALLARLSGKASKRKPVLAGAGYAVKAVSAQGEPAQELFRNTATPGQTGQAAPVEVGQSGIEGGGEKSAAASDAGDGGASAYTSRLLDAKKRARRQKP